MPDDPTTSASPHESSADGSGDQTQTAQPPFSAISTGDVFGAPPPALRDLQEGANRLLGQREIESIQRELNPEDGTLIYRLMERLGEGGMGVVYKAEQRSPIRRTVAVKVIKPGFDSAEVIARFESERQALARMDHPNIARVLDAGTDRRGRPYFVMEYVPGVPITRYADENRLSIPQRLALMLQVCDAIGHAHSKSVLHRDIKCSNVLAHTADEGPRVKVIDFGVAKALTSDRLTDRTFNTGHGQAIGTYESMSPEQADGSPDIDGRADVYSLGVLLYELLSGTKPFDRTKLGRAADAEIRRIIREEDPPRPSTQLTSTGDAGTKIAKARQLQLDSLSRQLKSELDWIALMALRKQRERRYATPQKMAEDISNYLANRPVNARPDSAAYRIGKFARRHRRSLVVAVVVLLISSISASVISWQHRQIAALRNELNHAVEPKPIAQGQAAPQAPEPGLMAKARLLEERGNKADQALAKIVLGQHDQADRIIQELKNQSGNTMDDLFQLLTLEGDNWYQAADFDKAADAYEKAMALNPKNINARNDATLALTFARLGNVAKLREQAIDISEGTLDLQTPGSVEWAITQNNLGLAWSLLPTGNRSENLQKAIDAYNAALSVNTRDSDPKNWAMTQNNLGIALGDLQTGDPSRNLQKAIAAYQQALTVCTRDTDPLEWAKIQNNLGVAYSHLPAGDPNDNLLKAIAAYQEALKVYTPDTHPAEWAALQNNLGAACITLTTGDPAENQKQAIAAYQSALKVYTRTADPYRWAFVENSIAYALTKSPEGTPPNSANIDRAIETARAALKVFSKEKTPVQWAMTQDTLGVALAQTTGPDSNENLTASITAFETALTVFTRTASPPQWAEEQANLAKSAAKLITQPAPAGAPGWLTRAIAADKAALLVYTATAYPREHDETAKHLNKLRSKYEFAGSKDATPFDAIPPAE